MKNKKQKFAPVIYVYACDEVDDVPVLVLANSLDDIPEDYNGHSVATYWLGETYKFEVKKGVR